ncbi:MAG: DUF2817 domain-containing protein [Zetaproteobacteria bacterium CG_4_9_14_3_um_filter_49_83]|nr:MAG: hypothetical protein AUJ56_09740 [Zetaproteobacteria bacterium CG1_02_49_23]PIQ30565.1 MAG: hypothetical protein COW62_12060 [Zetaproteobacteria bacterium CG17_big_fil_post_rev_8_21_14_2_50_50_13]PIY55137.1 MAG: DUF2817 domain-containing protein [Zetaproteobacteria bacterium CG_4_10_14_0_8_um_filter_49_80]PJA35780.1 MAG: DUF2817 domain-containing protein [Zetaproteobacteria bacterium CG_4_9_14_3_um_filter_49_83]
MAPVSPSDLSCFSRDYSEAREKFMTAARKASQHIPDIHVTSYAHPCSGPQLEPLATDTVWIGPHNAPSVLVLLSATHGVEGFSGSAAQTDFLSHPDALPEAVAVLIIHAINPHGFAWLRRVTEDGVDLNRNWLDFSLPLSEHNSGYDELADAIVPPALDAVTLKLCDAHLSTYRTAHGDIAYEKAVSAGQFKHPTGLFYGGTAPTWSRLTCERIISDFKLAERQRVALIDFHTGIGPFGYGEPICDHPPGSTGVKLARQWYGDLVTEPALGTSISVAKFGLSDYGWQALIGEPLVFIALEFGTYPFDEMMQALRADHWLHAQSQIDWQTDQTQKIKQAIRKHFYPATTDWQSMVLERSRQCITQALAGCGATLSDNFDL